MPLNLSIHPGVHVSCDKDFIKNPETLTRSAVAAAVLDRKSTDEADPSPQKLQSFRFEELSCGENVLGDRSADGEHRFIHDLAEPQIHRYAAKKVRVDIREAPAGDEQVDHARRGPSGGRDGIGARLDHDPLLSIPDRLLASRFDQRSCERLALMQLEPQRDVRRAFDAVDANLTVTLSGMRVAGGE